MRVLSVSAGRPKLVDYETSSLPTTGIEKTRQDGPVAITVNGVSGDEVADKVHHGDPHMRVYAYAVEDYAWWAGELGRPLEPGLFGEQLTTEGVDMGAAIVGEVWRVGTALLRIAHVRIPCQTFKGWMGARGYDDTAWVKRFTAAGRPGPYFSVLEEGEVEAGSEIEIVERPDHGVDVATMFAALTIRPDLLPRLRGVEGIKPAVAERAAQARG